MLTQVKVEQELMRLSELMEQRTNELADLAEQAAIAEADHKSAYAHAFVNTTGTGQFRENMATVMTCDALMRRKLKEATYQSCKESLHSIRAQLDALRTISANLRGQV